MFVVIGIYSIRIYLLAHVEKIFNDSLRKFKVSKRDKILNGSFTP